jgi:hypothetical protein
MDAKVHLARPVHHRDAEETIGLVRRDLRRQTAGESAGQVADHLAAVGHRHHRHRNFREPCPAPGRDFRPWASADAELGDFPERQERSAKLPPVASAGREQGAPVVPVEKVVGRPVQIHRAAEHPEAEHPVGAMARQVEVQVREPGAKQQAPAFPKRLEELLGQQQ